MTKSDDLHAKLAQSLDKANHKTKSKPKAPPAPGPRKCTKLSVSLFDGDMSRLDAISAYMAAHGHRISTSQVIKLALRTAPLASALEDALEEIKAEDGRRW